MENNKDKNRPVKVKQYPIRLGILNTIKTYSCANLNGLVTALRGNYSIHTIRKELTKMEKEEFIRSKRDENKNKIYYLKGHGLDYLEKINIKNCGYDEEYYSDILLHWGVYVDCKKIVLKGFPEQLKEINGIAINKENDMFGLVIQKHNESTKELKERIKQIVKIGNRFKKMYYVSFSSNIDDIIPNEIESEIKKRTEDGTELTETYYTEIEQFEYRAY